MKNFKNWTLLTVLTLMLASLSIAHGQNTPTDDAYINTASPTTNFGSATTLSVVNPSDTTYITFDLSSIPAGYTGANVAKASLKLYVNAVTTAGSFNVDYVNGAWTEKTITANMAPALGTTIAASVPLAKTNAHDYILVDVTAAVVAWLDGTQANDGLALVGNSPFSATFDSKESTSQSHPPELDIVLTGNGTGTITAVTAGSGLSGGGTKGNVTLSLLNTCAGGQVLQWNGTAWACSNASAGTITGVTAGTDLTGGGTSGNVTVNLNTTATDARYAQLNANNTFSKTMTFASGQTFPGAGSVSSVALAAPTSDFTVSGSPITGSGTLSLAWAVAPTSANTANAIVKRDASGNFAGNAVTASTLNASAVNAASATVSSALAINSAASNPLNVASSGSSATAIRGLASSATGEAWGVLGTTASSDPRAYGVIGTATSSTGTPKGVYGVASNSINGVGAFGQNGFLSSLASGGTLTVSGGGVWGDAGAGDAFSEIAAVVGTADDGPSGHFENNSPSRWITLVAEADDPNGSPFSAGNQANDTGCYIDFSGSLTCSGTVTSAVSVKGGTRKVAMPSIGSPSNWFEDAGSGQLVNGSTVVALDPDFIETVNTHSEYHVFLTPNGDCRGLYISNRTPSSFEVRELGGGTASVPFSYRIMALRKNYESIRFADHTNDPTFKRMMRKPGQPGKPAAKSGEVKKQALANTAGGKGDTL